MDGLLSIINIGGLDERVINTPEDNIMRNDEGSPSFRDILSLEGDVESDITGVSLDAGVNTDVADLITSDLDDTGIDFIDNPIDQMALAPFQLQQEVREREAETRFAKGGVAEEIDGDKESAANTPALQYSSTPTGQGQYTKPLDPETIGMLKDLIPVEGTGHNGTVALTVLERFMSAYKKVAAEKEGVSLDSSLSKEVSEGSRFDAGVIKMLDGLIPEEGIESRDPQLLAVVERFLKEQDGLKDHLVSDKSDKVLSRTQDNTTVMKAMESGNDTSNPLLRHRGKPLDIFSEQLPSEDDLTIESGLNLTSEVNGKDTPNRDQMVRVFQSVMQSHGIGDELLGQHRNKQMRDNKTWKEDDGKLMRAEMAIDGVSGKPQSPSRVETADGADGGGKTAAQHTIHSSQLGEMVVQGARRFLNGGNPVIHLNVKNPDLGNLKISFMENNQGQLGIILLAERHDAAELIRQNVPEIKDLLLQQGIDLNKFDVLDPHSGNRHQLAQEDFFMRNPFNKRQSMDGYYAGKDETGDQGLDLDMREIGRVEGPSRLNLLV